MFYIKYLFAFDLGSFVAGARIMSLHIIMELILRKRINQVKLT